MTPVVAIVGRPNVGKSTLFNRLIGRQVAIVSDIPGTTRDRIFADTTFNNHVLTLIDTGGLELAPSTQIAAKVKAQAEIAINEADVIMLLVDATDGLLPADIEIAEQLRRSGKPVIVVVNKVDNEKLETAAGEFYRLGIEPLVMTSALHGRGIAALKETVAAMIPKTDERPTATPTGVPKLAIVGRPGVGKSTLLNTILGQERVIVGETPGTTRDSINTTFHYKDKDLILIDTGGLRRRGHIKPGIEYYSVIRTLRAIEQCDVSLLVLDASAPVTAQDTHVAQYIIEAYKSVVIVANKWDLVPAQSGKECQAVIRRRLRFLSFAPLVVTSAMTGTGINDVLDSALEVWEQRNIALPDKVVDDIIRKSFAEHQPVRRGFAKLEIYGARQESANPPKFVVEVNEPDLVHFSYRRYLEKNLRRVCAFKGTPLIMVFKKTIRKGVRHE